MPENQVGAYVKDIDFPICVDHENYKGEMLMIIDETQYRYSCKEWIKWWQRGHPMVVKFGYQFRQLDPDFIIVTFDTDYKDLHYSIKNLPTMYEHELENAEIKQTDFRPDTEMEQPDNGW